MIHYEEALHQVYVPLPFTKVDVVTDMAWVCFVGSTTAQSQEAEPSAPNVWGCLL